MPRATQRPWPGARRAARGAALLAALFGATLSAAPTALPPTGVEPQPFRLDAALGAGAIDLNEESFLLRWGYRLDFPLVGDGELWGTGLWTAAGSVRSTEFAAETWLHERVELEGWGTLEARYARDEDLDGRYDHLLLGMGWRFAEGWSATLLADAQGEKELIDAQLELAWSAGRERFRLALVLTDFQYDQKQTAAAYLAAPVTLFAERWWALGATTDLYAFANANLETRWRELAGPGAVDERGATAGLGLRRRLDGDRMLRLMVQGSTTERATADALGAQALERRHLEAALQHERTAFGRPAWVGVRALALDEDRAGVTTAVVRRRELMLYAGSRFRWSERTTFAPELVLDQVDLRDDRQGDPTDQGLLGKLSFPIEVVLDARRGARLTFDAGLKLHELKFGGAQLALSVPF